MDLHLYFTGKGAAPDAKSKIKTIEHVKAEREQSRAASRPVDAKAKFHIFYWQGVPPRVKPWDDLNEIKAGMAPRFVVRIDSLAQSKGLTSTDDVLLQWKWNEEQERAGVAEEVVQAVKLELEEKFP